MDNSSNSDEIYKPLELTVDEMNELQILLNKLWNLQNFADKFNENIDKMFADFKYALKSIDTDIANNPYFDTLENNTIIFKENLVENTKEYESKIEPYLDKLKTHKFNATWENEWIKRNIPERIYPKEVIDNLKNYFSNISSFNLPCCLVIGRSEIFLENVLSSEPLFLHYKPDDQERVEKFLLNFSEPQRAKFRLYINPWDLPKGLIANIIAWDYIHLIDTSLFEEETVGLFYNMLRPGGLLTFNYPNIYNPDDFDLITRHLYGAYEPSFIQSKLLKTGFEIIKHDRDNQIFYVKKPGILNINKSSPTLSTVVNIDSLFNKK